MWFPLLDTVIAPRKEMLSNHSVLDGNDKELEVILKDLAQHVLTSMMSHMSLPALLQKIIQVFEYIVWFLFSLILHYIPVYDIDATVCVS